MKHLLFTKTTKLIFLIISSLFLLNCHFTASYEDRIEDKIEAETVSEQFYALLKAKKYNDTYKLFSKKFLQVSDTMKLNKEYNLLSRKLGGITSDSLHHWETHIVKGTNPSSVYIFYYLVKREKFESKETVTMSKEDGIIKIDGYHVNSDGLNANTK